MDMDMDTNMNMNMGIDMDMDTNMSFKEEFKKLFALPLQDWDLYINIRFMASPLRI